MGLFNKFEDDKKKAAAESAWSGDEAEDWGVAEELEDEPILDAVSAPVVPVNPEAASKARDTMDLRKKRK